MYQIEEKNASRKTEIKILLKILTLGINGIK